MTSSEFIAKWNLGFADNEFQNIVEGSFRDFKDDLVAVLGQRENHLGLQPSASIADFVESVRVLLSAAGGVLAYDAATGTFSVQAAPIFAGDVFAAGPGEFGAQAENADRLVKRGELVNYLNKWSWKQLVRGATQVNLNLGGPPPGTVDGIAFGPGRWLVRAQTNAAENGIYTYSPAAGWVRAPEADTWQELINATVFVSQGTNSHDKLYTCTVDEGGTLGTDAVAWQLIGAATVFQFGAGFTVTGNSVTVDVAQLKTLLGLGSAAYLPVPATVGAAAGTGEVVRGDDPRLSDPRTPTAHSQGMSTITGLQAALDGKQAVDVLSVLAYASSMALDFTVDNVRTITLAGNLTFSATTNKAAGRQKLVRLVGGSTPYALAFPGWTWLGAGAPVSLVAGKTAVLSLYCFGTAETDVVAAYSVQP